MITLSRNELQSRFSKLKDEKPNLRIRDAARELSVSEAELVALNCGTPATTRLRGPWGDFVKKLPTVGRVMALARNEAAVHERKGCYEKVEIFGPMGMVLGKDIDLRLFPNAWHIGFALREEVEGEVRRSFQVFDRQGTAIHKVYLQEQSAAGAFEEIVSAFADDNQSVDQPVDPEPAAEPELPDSDIDVGAFQTAWDGMADTHEFHMLTRKFRLGREQALRLAGPERAYRVNNDSTRTLLDRASASGQLIMVFVGNRGIIQIHSGSVQNIKVAGPWLNVLDPDFNLHLREDLVANSWVVKKPTRNGQITSLELYDEKGENIALFFGKRSEGESERSDWRTLAESFSKV